MISFTAPADGDPEHLDAELILRDGLPHPDLASFIEPDTGITLEQREGEQLLRMPGLLDPEHGAEIEQAIWDKMHFASHLRSQRLGEFTVGTDLHRSESLALVQLLILYHLVNARATIALGGDDARSDGRSVRTAAAYAEPV